MRELTQKDSKVEVTGSEAKYYDTLMNIITLGTYPSFIRQAIKDLNLKKGEDVLDLGCGTGRNDCIMLKYIGEDGSIAGVEIGKEMKEKFFENCDKPNISLIDKRIAEIIYVAEKGGDQIYYTADCMVFKYDNRWFRYRCISFRK